MGLSYAATDILEKTFGMHPMYASMAVFLAGLLKEVSDSKHPPNFFDSSDLIADGLGIGLQSLVNGSKDFKVSCDNNLLKMYYSVDF